MRPISFSAAAAAAAALPPPEEGGRKAPARDSRMTRISENARTFPAR